MIHITLEKIVEVSEGSLINPVDASSCTRFEIDSRRVDQTTYFMPILGEVQDGHIFIKGALEKGAPISFCERAYFYSHYNDLKDLPLILVDNTTRVLHRLTKYILNRLKVKVVGITGSVGKTSTKEFVYHVLSQSFEVHKNLGNFNNHIGLPLTVMALEEKHEIAVLEMGMNHFKEIETLADIARPLIGVVTNIGTSHIGILGSKENIFQAKMEITSYFDQHNHLIVNGLDEHLKSVKSDIFDVVSIGSDLEAKEIHLQSNGCYEYQVVYDNKSYLIKLNVLGKHNVINSLLAFAVGLKFDMKVEDIIRGLESFVDNTKRLEIIKTEQGTVVSDCYNASQESMISAIEVLSSMTSNNRIAILGDVLELGEYSKVSHEFVGEYIHQQPVHHLLTYGQASKYIGLKAIELGFDAVVKHFEAEEDLMAYLYTIIDQTSAILVKGSLGMGMSSIVNKLKGDVE